MVIEYRIKALKSSERESECGLYSRKVLEPVVSVCETVGEYT